MNWRFLFWMTLTVAALVGWHESADAQSQAPQGRLVGSYRGGEVWRVQDRNASCYVVVNSDGKAAGISCVGEERRR